MRARNLKPGFFTNDVLLECNPLARILFAGLWCAADREGRLEDRPKKIKIELLPCDDCDTDALLQQLHDSGLIVRYVVGNNHCIQIVSFLKHQKPHMKEAVSCIPSLDDVEHQPRQVLATTKEVASPASSLNPSSLNPESIEERDLLVLPASPAKTNRSLAFEKFWKAYPKTNGSKKKTLERWKQIRGEARHEEIMRGLEGYFADCDKRRSAGEFVPEHPFPQKWLGEERWKTYLTEEGASAGGADFSIKTDAFLQACLETVRNGGSLQGRALAHVTTTLGESWREHV